MENVIQFLFLSIGFIMLVKGADWFVDGTSGIADRFGVSQLVIGLTIVAMGTSMPEAAVSITAALRGNVSISVGNIVGSNILNILIILGISSVITTIAVSKSTIKYEIPYMIVITVMLLVMGYTGNEISSFEGIILLCAFLLYLVYMFVMAKKNKIASETIQRHSLWYLIIITIAGLVLIVSGSNVTVDAASKIAINFGISQRIIGLTIVALGTSLPELFTSVSAARKNKADIAIGNIVGSNIFNILFILGTSAVITTISFKKEFFVDTIVAAGAAVLLLICTITRQRLARISGIIMLSFYAVYFVYLIF